MINFQIIEVNKANKIKYLDKIASLELQVLQDMENKKRIGQLFITGREDIEEYIDSKNNSVIIAIDENEEIKAATYITQNQTPFTYNDITKYFKYGKGYKEYVKSLYGSSTEYQIDMLTAYDIKLKAFRYATNKILEECSQYSTISEFLEHELNDDQNRFHEKSLLRELINQYMFQYIDINMPRYKQLYERFYWLNINDIRNEMDRNINIHNDIAEYEEIMNGSDTREHTHILDNSKLRIYYECENMQNYYTSNTENSVEIDTYITNPNNRQNGLARVLVFEGIKRHIEKHFENPNNEEIFLCSTLHKNNLSSKYVSEFFGLKDSVFVNRRQGRDREVHICKISREEAKQYLEDMSKKIAILYGYNPYNKLISKYDEISILQMQLEYEKNEIIRLKRMKKRNRKKFNSLKGILRGKRNKVDYLKGRIKQIKNKQKEEDIEL